jgi:copper transporter 1
MDHSHHAAMDHSHMDHGDMGGGHDMPMCSMNVSYHRNLPIMSYPEPRRPSKGKVTSRLTCIQMLFTWDTTNLCIVFPSWRITGTLSLIVSLLAVVALTAGYEAIREVSRRYEERLEKNVREAPRKYFHHLPISPK